MARVSVYEVTQAANIHSSYSITCYTDHSMLKMADVCKSFSVHFVWSAIVT